jgi:hypothetical protein
MSLVKISAAIVATLSLTQCASFQNSSVADYNRDGLVSDAEFKQYEKSQVVQRSNVATERAKRENAVDTVWDASSAIQGVHSIRNGLRAF